ncbi:endonuclease I family protein [Prevotella sp.]|uniref:endonuclease I family protein n=1 Tax=Prevotella sp. TaxID=59823 RepID=UPI00257A3106|nr:endonuclease [Prevotella sp.]
MNRYFKMVIATALIGVTTSANAIDRKTLAQYASSLQGLKKEQLKAALHKLMDKKKVLPYGGGGKGTWWGFWYSDRDPQTNECYNRYSDKKFYFESTNTGKSIAGMNIEHSFPKSWWGGHKNDAWCDLYNLYPSDSQANSSKSNFVMGVVVNVTEEAGAGYDKVGTGYADGRLVKMWEPGDRFKGEFSRSYMYMATTYQNLSFVSEGAKQLQTGAYPTLKKWSSDLFRQWSKNDRVDEMEIKRNEAIYKIQNNRNLFIDYPNLAEYVWGDSMDVEFNPYRSITTASDDARYTSVIVPEDPITPDDPQVTPQGGTFVKTTTAPVAGKRYVLVAKTGSNFVIVSTLKGKPYGYLPTKSITDNNEKVNVADDQSVLTLEQGTTGFYIKDANDKYFGQEDKYKTVQFVTKDKAVEWTLEPKADGTFTITSSTGHVLQYDTKYKTFGAYKPASANGIYPMLYVEDTTAGIGTVWTVTTTDDAVYNLQGVRMPADAQLAPGIYIRGGKKFIVR